MTKPEKNRTCDTKFKDSGAPDVLEEWAYGFGAVRLSAKMYVRPCSPGQNILVAALGFRSDGDKNGITGLCSAAYERWDGEVLILPQRKFKCHADGRPAGGWRIDQLVCSNLLNEDESWHEYWKRQE